MNYVVAHRKGGDQGLGRGRGHMARMAVAVATTVDDATST